jgi:DNA (cytosine-5)-methyltransferase 1
MVAGTMKANNGGGGWSNSVDHAAGGYMVPVGVTIHGTDKTARVASYTNIAGSLRANTPGRVENSSTTVVQQPVPFCTTQITSAANYSRPQPGDPCHPLAAGAHPPAIAFAQNQRDEVRVMPVAGALAAEPGAKQQTYVCVEPAIAFHPTQDPISSTEISHALNANANANATAAVVAPTITAANNPSRSPQSSEVTQQVAAVLGASMQVRRLTPEECEALQGFPRSYTAIPWRGKPASACPDGPRYKALGNSMAVPVMAWIGERIAAVEAIREEAAA